MSLWITTIQLISSLTKKKNKKQKKQLEAWCHVIIENSLTTLLKDLTWQIKIRGHGPLGLVAAFPRPLVEPSENRPHWEPLGRFRHRAEKESSNRATAESWQTARSVVSEVSDNTVPSEPRTSLDQWWGVQSKLQTLFVTQENFRNFPGGPGVKTPAHSPQGAQVQSLVKELGIPHATWCSQNQKKQNFLLAETQRLRIVWCLAKDHALTTWAKSSY